MKIRFLAIGLVLILPLLALSQSAPQKPASPKPAPQQAKPVSPTSPPKQNDDGENQTVKREPRWIEPAERGGGRPYRELLNEGEHVSSRHFSEQELEPRFLSTLLWEVSATQREEGKPLDSRGVDIYLVTRDYVALYDREGQMLQIIEDGKDMRQSILGPENLFAARAPLILIYVANNKKLSQLPANKRDFYAAMDCGIASRATYLFCASEHLVTITLDVDPVAVGKILGLKSDKVLLAQPVGFR